MRPRGKTHTQNTHTHKHTHQHTHTRTHTRVHTLANLKTRSSQLIPREKERAVKDSRGAEL